MNQFLTTRQVKTTIQSTMPPAPGYYSARRIWNFLAAMLLFGLSISAQGQIAQRGSSTNNSVTGTNLESITIDYPAGVVAGDLVVASIVQNETDNDNGGLATITANGWTVVDGRLIRSDGTGNGNNAWYGTVLYRVADGTEGASFTFNMPNTRADMIIGSLVAFSGVTVANGVKANGTSGGPFDLDPGILNLTNASTNTALSVTTVTPNAAVLMISMVNDDNTHSGWAATNPSSLTELYDDNTTSQDDAAIAAAWAIRSTAGATGNGTVNLSASDRGAAMFLVLKPSCIAIPSVVSGSRCGTGSVVLTGSSATGTVYWYDVPAGGSSLGSGNTFNTPSISSTKTYYAEAVAANGCISARAAVQAVVNSLPTVSSTADNSRCGSGTVSISATPSAGTIEWYSAASGGSSLGSGSSFATPSISSTTTYFAEAVSAAGCISASRTAVLATVKTVPTITSTTPGSNCGSGTVSLGAAASAGTISWYATSSSSTVLGTGTSYTTPSISNTTTYFAEATDNGCSSSPRTAVTATINTTPSVSSFLGGSRCGTGSVTLFANPSAGASLNWFTAASGGSAIASGNSFTTPVLSATTIYYVQASIGTCTQPTRTAVTATVNTFPVVNISANYCSAGGNVTLNATAGMSSYLWSTGQTAQNINVDQAGAYSVIGTNAAGCKDTANFGVATELVTNGSFDAGNSGFTTSYTFVADQAGINSELNPEGTYSVVANPQNVHSNFYGADRKGDGGNIMVINGSPVAGSGTWNQNNITVLPNTTYYFSAWAVSLVNGNNAAIQFSVNGNQVGTIAYLQNGYTNTAGPYNWVRFYGQWNSGAATNVNLSIVNLNTAPGGNDFALDDISFGTMSPIALSVSPIVNIGGSACQGDALILHSEAVGGASPFTYSWTGPNGFTSTLENPQVSAAASTTQNGTYSVTVTDGFGCIANSNVVVAITSLPNNQTLTAAAGSVCGNGSTTINLASSQTGVFYQLRDDADNSPIGNLVEGTGSALSLSTGLLTASKTFNVLATRYPSGCEVQMSSTPSVSISTTPELSITNQAVCSGTVNLTAASVTAGSTGSGTLSYWTDAGATTALSNPSAVAVSGTYYIKSTNGACSDVEPVVVSISATPSAAFSYSASSFCTSGGADPAPTVTGTSGVFTANSASLVFVNANTGQIDLSASAPGTYTITNTVTPSGACAPVSVAQSVTITAAPLAGFSYTSNDFCQSANALNASPVFDAGAAAGTFSSSAGLSINAATGVITVSTSTPGNYAVVNTRAATGGCPSFADTNFIDINPYIFTGGVTSSVSDNEICEGENVSLSASAGSYATVLLRERFNGSINNWVRTNNSSGGTPANAAWTLRANNYAYGAVNFRSNDQTQFYLSNSQEQGSGGNTSTILRSPAMSTIGFSTLSLDFFHFYDFRNSSDVAKVQVSTNNTTWTDLASYTVDKGTSTGFVNEAISMNAYIGLPTVYIRFLFTASNDRYWAIDNVSVTGNSTNYNYSWTSSPAGYNSTVQAPSAVAPVTNTFYIATATNRYGCSNPASPVPVVVNPLPADNAGADQNICGSGSVNIGAAGTSGNTYSWSPATGLSSTSVANPTATPGTTRTYTLTETITATGCSRNSSVVLNVIALPSITSSTPAARCGDGTLNLAAVSSTGTLNWFTSAVGGTAIGSANSFTTPSLSTTTTYFAEATSASCAAASRTAVTATINAAPVISSQSTASANYSQNQVANALSVSATAGSGSISSYAWYSNISASTTGGTLIAGSNADSYVPSTATTGTLYYYCVVTNSNGCTITSAVSGAINTIVSPAFTSVSATLPSIPGQASASGYNGQTITITGSNFAANATVSLNGVAATSVVVSNSGNITAVVANSGPSTNGTITVTNPSTGAFASMPFSFVGYLTKANGIDWSNTSCWLGNAVPTAGSDVNIRHNLTIPAGVSVSCNRIEIKSGSTLTFASEGSISVVDLVNDGTIDWTSNGTLNLGGTLVMAASGSFIPGNGTVVYNKAGDQTLVTGAIDEIEFNNLQLQGSGIKTIPAGMDIEINNLSIGSGVTFNPGTTASEIMLNGNLTIDGSLASSNSDFHFNSSADQSISVVGTGTAVMSGLRVNKPAGTLLLDDNVRVLDSLTMTSGNINTQGNILEIGSNLANKGVIAYTSGYIHGKLRRWYAGTNSGTATGLFPMGELKAGNVWENRNAMLEYTTAPTVGGHLTVEFIPESMNANVTGTQTIIDSSSTGGTGFNISTFAEEGYWKIDNQAGTLTDGAYTIALTAENFTSIGADLSMLSMVKRVSMGDWFAPGQHIAPTGDFSLVTISRSGVSGFSNFGFGIGEPNVPLPVTISSMSVNCDGLYPSLNWTTVSEQDASAFIIQQSADGRSWSELGSVAAAGNSSKTLRYSYSLKEMNNASFYVRLVLQNKDASQQAFAPLAVSCRRSVQKEAMQLFPNPNSGKFSIDLKSIEVNYSVRVLNSMGVEVAQTLHNATRSGVVQMDLSGFASGIYQVLVGTDGQASTQSFKVVVR